MTPRRAPAGPSGARSGARPGTRRGGVRSPRPRSTSRPREERLTDSSGSLPRVADRPRRTLRGRVTGRAVVLVLICLMLAVSFASSLKAYVQQRSQIQALKTEIAQRRAAIEDLEAEKARWQDPFFVGQQARERFGYLLPGERSFVVLDADGQPLKSEAALADPETAIRTTPTPWWDSAWASVTLAGHPPEQVPQKETVPPEEIPFEEDQVGEDGQ